MIFIELFMRHKVSASFVSWAKFTSERELLLTTFEGFCVLIPAAGDVRGGRVARRGEQEGKRRNEATFKYGYQRRFVKRYSKARTASAGPQIVLLFHVKANICINSFLYLLKESDEFPCHTFHPETWNESKNNENHINGKRINFERNLKLFFLVLFPSFRRKTS